MTLRYLGTGLADRKQAVPFSLQSMGTHERAPAGQFLTVYATTADTRRGLATSRASVVRAMNGQAVVYEHVSAERFVSREVRTEAIDGTRCSSSQGSSPGKRIVTQGANSSTDPLTGGAYVHISRPFVRP